MIHHQKEGIPDNHHSIVNASLVSEICTPFFQKHNLNYFSYTRTYFDGTGDILCTHKTLPKYHLEQKYPITFPEIIDKNKGRTFFLIPPQKYQKIVDSFRNNFNVDNMINISEIHNNHIETCFFGAPSDNHQVVNFYLNNLNLLENFYLDFKEKSNSLTKEAQNNKLMLPSEMLNEFNRFKNSASKQSTVKRYKLSGTYNNISITQRELDTLKEIAKGNTAKQAAQNLQLSPRTVESYINNVKLKLDLCKTTKIINLLHQANLL